MSSKGPKQQKESSEAIKQLEAYLKSIGAKDKTAERMGKSSITIRMK